MVLISTSILNKKDGETIMRLNNTDTDFIHIDVMDGYFVSNQAFSISEIESINLITKKKLDVHLMVNDPFSYLDYLVNLNASYITVHYEVLKEFSIFDKIKQYGIKCGVSVKPNTDVKQIFEILDKIDLVLIMSVEPGYGGQSFMESSLLKIKVLKEEVKKRNLSTLISVDGGINKESAVLCRKNGVDILVSGTFITSSDDFQKKITLLRGTTS